MSTETELTGYGTHLRKSRDELVVENEEAFELLAQVKLYQFAGYMEWQKRRDDLLSHRTTKEAETCDHKQYDPNKHGRYCPCGVQMWDAGD